MTEVFLIAACIWLLAALIFFVYCSYRLGKVAERLDTLAKRLSGKGEKE